MPAFEKHKVSHVRSFASVECPRGQQGSVRPDTTPLAPASEVTGMSLALVFRACVCIRATGGQAKTGSRLRSASYCASTKFA